MKNVILKQIRAILLCALALLGVLIATGTMAHADLTGPKPPNPPIGSGAMTTTSQNALLGAR